MTSVGSPGRENASSAHESFREESWSLSVSTVDEVAVALPFTNTAGGTTDDDDVDDAPPSTTCFDDTHIHINILSRTDRRSLDPLGNSLLYAEASIPIPGGRSLRPVKNRQKVYRQSGCSICGMPNPFMPPNGTPTLTVKDKNDLGTNGLRQGRRHGFKGGRDNFARSAREKKFLTSPP